ncbi:MAG TPA: urease accessory protein UreD [Chthoniobacteraceae bacterium]|nr:urease accessory protein UreD [Chthoniobacteraceae bacterium]
MIGHLDLVCGLASNGLSQLNRQSFRAPMHISKPHVDAGTLVVNVVNPTAGLFEGDEVTCDVRVESGARLLLTAPSATRAHCVPGTGEARLAQHFAVQKEGWLEIWPELFIPQAGTRYRQKTRIDLDNGAGLLFFETLAPGRVASGEAFEFQWLDWETDIFYAGEKVVREKYRISPDSLRAMIAQFPTGYYASVFLFHAAITGTSACWRALDAMQEESLWIGHSALRRAGWSVKILAADSVRFRKALQAVRQSCHESMGSEMPSVRRN